MNKLDFICPFCMLDKQEKIFISENYEEDYITIAWECPSCKFRGEWERVPRKPSLFVRFIQAIKRAWG